eukprot:803167-Pelagomonas_calceolata.AAC.3
MCVLLLASYAVRVCGWLGSGGSCCRPLPRVCTRCCEREGAGVAWMGSNSVTAVAAVKEELVRGAGCEGGLAAAEAAAVKELVRGAGCEGGFAAAGAVAKEGLVWGVDCEGGLVAAEAAAVKEGLEWRSRAAAMAARCPAVKDPVSARMACCCGGARSARPCLCCCCCCCCCCFCCKSSSNRVEGLGRWEVVKDWLLGWTWGGRAEAVKEWLLGWGKGRWVDGVGLRELRVLCTGSGCDVRAVGKDAMGMGWLPSRSDLPPPA